MPALANKRGATSPRALLTSAQHRPDIHRIAEQQINDPDRRLQRTLQSPRSWKDEKDRFFDRTDHTLCPTLHASIAHSPNQGLESRSDRQSAWSALNSKHPFPPVRADAMESQRSFCDVESYRPRRTVLDPCRCSGYRSSRIDREPLTREEQPAIKEAR